MREEMMNNLQTDRIIIKISIKFNMGKVKCLNIINVIMILNSKKK